MNDSQQSGDAEWIGGIVECYEQQLVRYASRLLGDGERARDVVQDTFLKLCRQERQQINGSIAGWLYAVCRNRAFDVRRKEQRMNPVDQATTEAISDREVEPAERLEMQDSAHAASLLLETLPENQREVIRLKIEHDMSYREISEITGMSVSNVGYLLHTGLKTIRQRFARL